MENLKEKKEQQIEIFKNYNERFESLNEMSKNLLSKDEQRLRHNIFNELQSDLGVSFAKKLMQSIKYFFLWGWIFKFFETHKLKAYTNEQAKAIEEYLKNNK